MGRIHQNFLAKDREWKVGSDGVDYVSYRTDPDDRTRPLSVLSKYPPHHRVEPHTHDCDYTEVILEGDITIGKERLVKGDVRISKGGTGYGPLVAGADGCLLLIVFDRAEGALMRPVGKAAKKAEHAE